LDTLQDVYEVAKWSAMYAEAQVAVVLAGVFIGVETEEARPEEIARAV
jgi:hypothetical protein